MDSIQYLKVPRFSVILEEENNRVGFGKVDEGEIEARSDAIGEFNKNLDRVNAIGEELALLLPSRIAENMSSEEVLQVTRDLWYEQGKNNLPPKVFDVVMKVFEKNATIKINEENGEVVTL